MHPTHIYDDDDAPLAAEEEEREIQNSYLQWMGHLIISMSHIPFSEIFDSTKLKPINAQSLKQQFPQQIQNLATIEDV